MSGVALAATHQCEGPADCRGTEMTDQTSGDDVANLAFSLGGAGVTRGRDGGDTLEGGPGKDELYGLADDDTIKGGDRDVLDCGDATDTAHHVVV